MTSLVQEIFCAKILHLSILVIITVYCDVHSHHDFANGLIINNYRHSLTAEAQTVDFSNSHEISQAVEQSTLVKSAKL
jgi:hypothetical protein